MKKMLIIEDEQSLASLLKMNLERTGRYEIAISNDGRDGLKQARELKPDLIILDLVLPGLPGEQVCRELKSEKDTEAIPIIMLTAKARDAERVVGRVIGADAYMVKPIPI